jgi:uncharacterized protein (TIGR00369 family)
MRTDRIWEEPSRGDYPDLRMIGLSGLDNLRTSIDMGGPRPPMSHLTGLSLVDATVDSVVFEMPASSWFLSSQEQISVGPLMMLADAALACALLVGLPPRTPQTTAELSMTFLKPCRPGGIVRAVAAPLYEGRPLGISQTWIEDGHGDRVAFGTSACYVLPEIDGVEPPDETKPYEHPIYDTPDPYLREPSGATIPWETWRTMSGLAILRSQIDGELPQPPIHYLTGLTLRAAGEGTTTFTMPASRWLTSPARSVQGGLLAMLAHAALSTAVVSTLEPGTAYRPVDVKVNYLRPVFPDEKELTARGSVIHRGRTLGVANAEVLGTDGKKVVVATGSTMIMPERV